LESDPGQFKEFSGGIVYWQTDSKNCYSYLTKGSKSCCSPSTIQLLPTVLFHSNL
jgi:hypothetical protein